MPPMSVENAIMSLYENESLTGDLDDKSAKLLLKWAESQLTQMAFRQNDEDTFDEEFKQLRFLVKSINRYAAKRDDMPLAEQQVYVNERVIGRARNIGYSAQVVDDEALSGWVREQQSVDQLACVQATIKLLEDGASIPPAEASAASDGASIPCDDVDKDAKDEEDEDDKPFWRKLW